MEGRCWMPKYIWLQMLTVKACRWCLKLEGSCTWICNLHTEAQVVAGWLCRRPWLQMSVRSCRQTQFSGDCCRLEADAAACHWGRRAALEVAFLNLWSMQVGAFMEWLRLQLDEQSCRKGLTEGLRGFLWVLKAAGGVLCWRGRRLTLDADGCQGLWVEDWFLLADLLC